MTFYRKKKIKILLSHQYGLDEKIKIKTKIMIFGTLKEFINET